MKKKKIQFCYGGIDSMEISIFIPYKECLNEYKFCRKYYQAKVGWLIISNQIQFIPFYIFRLSFACSLARSIAPDALLPLYIQIFGVSIYQDTKYKTDRISYFEYVSWLLQLTNRFNVAFVILYLFLCFSLLKIIAGVNARKSKGITFTNAILRICNIIRIYHVHIVYTI